MATKRRNRPIYPPPKRQGFVSMECSLKLDVQQLTHWEPSKVHALMNGIAQVIAAGQSQASPPTPRDSHERE